MTFRPKAEPRDVAFPRWLVLTPNDPHEKLAVLTGRLTKRKAQGMAQSIAGATGGPVVMVEERRGEKNPTLVHHGLARGAAFHITSDLSGPIADLYSSSPMVARALAQLLSNAIGERVEVTRNTLVGKGSVHSRLGSRLPRARFERPSRNPEGDPKAGEVWTTLEGGQRRVIALNAVRVQVLNLETGEREWINRSEFGAIYRAPRVRRNPKGRKSSRRANPFGHPPGQKWRAHDRVRLVGTQKRGTVLHWHVRQSNDRPDELVVVVKWDRGATEQVAPAQLRRPDDPDTNPSRSKRARASRQLHRDRMGGLNRKTRRAAVKATRRAPFPGNAAQAIYYLHRQRSRKYPNPMDRATAEHFYAWLEAVVAPPEQHQVEQDIHALLRDHPKLVDTHSWTEMRELAERARPNPNIRIRHIYYVESRGGAHHVIRTTMSGRGKHVVMGAYPTEQAATDEWARLSQLERERAIKAAGRTRNPSRSEYARVGRVIKRKKALLPRRAYRARAAGRSAKDHYFTQRTLQRLGARTAAAQARRDREDGRTPNPDSWMGWKTGDRFVLKHDISLHEGEFKAGTPGRLTLVSGPPIGTAFAVFDTTPHLYPVPVSVKWLGRPGRRTPNPRGRKQSRTGGEMARARRTAEMWNEFPATTARRMRIRSRTIPRTLVKLGDVHSVVYRSNKYDGKHKLHEHRFKRPLPVLASDPDGRVAHFVGGGYKITGDGLVD